MRTLLSRMMTVKYIENASTASMFENIATEPDGDWRKTRTAATLNPSKETTGGRREFLRRTSKSMRRTAQNVTTRADCDWKYLLLARICSSIRRLHQNVMISHA